MKPTSDLSKKTKTELTALARRKKIPVTSGMLKEALIRAIKKGLRKIEAQKKSKTTKAKSRKRSPASKTTRRTVKTKSPKTSKAKTARAKTARKPKTTARKTASIKGKQTSAKKKTTRKTSPAKGKVKRAPAKKPVARKPQTARPPRTAKGPARSKPVETDLPGRYEDHRLAVMARDPNWAYAYWDLNPKQVRHLLKSAGQTADKARWILRVYSAALQPVEEKGHYFDVDINVEGGNYYLNLARPGARFIVEIGVFDTTGLFRSTAQSNPVILPLDRPSDTLAQESTFSGDMTSPGASTFTKPPSSRS
ncbi:MAG: DUF4912 domain-containing protein [Nitrospinota bacterium]|nr:DUF4912 domain-containing protein [Nitrospinota bacterium]